MITFNAVGNNLTGKILKAMPENGTIYQYSNISMKPLGEFMSEEFLFKNKSLHGFWVSRYLPSLPEADIAAIKQAVADDIAPDGPKLFATSIQGEYPMEKYEEARTKYLKHMTQGKVLIRQSP